MRRVKPLPSWTARNLHGGAPPLASALAADYLARPDASTLVLVGAGALGAHFVRAYAAVRPIKWVFIYNRSPEKAAALAAELKKDGFEASSVVDLEKAIGQADIVS
jgi:alanine dehydrogenase